MVSNAYPVGGTLWVIAILVGLVILVLWIILPFAVFSARGLLQRILEEQRKTNQLLTTMIERMK